MKVKDRGLPNRQSEGGDDFCLKTSVLDAKLIRSGGESGQAIKAVLVGHHAAFNSLGGINHGHLGVRNPGPCRISDYPRQIGGGPHTLCTDHWASRQEPCQEYE